MKSRVGQLVAIGIATERSAATRLTDSHLFMSVPMAQPLCGWLMAYRMCPVPAAATQR